MPPLDDPNDAEVRYSVKELLGNLQKTADAGFAALRASLDTKADRSQIDDIHRTIAAHAQRLDAHGQEIGHLKDQQRSDEAASAALSRAHEKRVSGQQWIIGTVITLALVAATLIPLFIRHG